MNKGLKKESSVAGLAGTALAFHMAPNIAMKWIHSTERGKKILADTMRAGFEHGASGKKLGHGKERFLRLGIGPESLTDYHIGRAAGALSRGSDKEVRQIISHITGGDPQKAKAVYQSIDRVKRMMENTDPSKVKRLPPEVVQTIREIPHVNVALEAVKRQDEKAQSKVLSFFRKGAVPESSKPSLKQNLVHSAVLAGAGAAEPHILFQPAISKGRELTAKSRLGRWFFRRSFERGLEGKRPGRLKRIAGELIVSPSIYEAQDVGYALKRLNEQTLNAPIPTPKKAPKKKFRFRLRKKK